MKEATKKEAIAMLDLYKAPTQMQIILPHENIAAPAISQYLHCSAKLQTGSN